MPALDDQAAKLALLESLHSSAVTHQQRVAAERAETEDAFGAEEQAQRDAIEETMTPVLEMAHELEELGEEMKDAEAGVFQMLRDNGVSGRTRSRECVDRDRRACSLEGSFHCFIDGHAADGASHLCVTVRVGLSSPQ